MTNPINKNSYFWPFEAARYLQKEKYDGAADLLIGGVDINKFFEMLPKFLDKGEVEKLPSKIDKLVVKLSEKKQNDLAARVANATPVSLRSTQINPSATAAASSSPERKRPLPSLSLSQPEMASEERLSKEYSHNIYNGELSIIEVIKKHERQYKQTFPLTLYKEMSQELAKMGDREEAALTLMTLINVIANRDKSSDKEKFLKSLFEGFPKDIQETIQESWKKSNRGPFPY